MIAVVQQVKKAKLLVDNELISEINTGLIIYLGIWDYDKEYDYIDLAKKIVKTRMFKNSDNKINLTINDIKGDIMVVSNFTLCADMSKSGTRPSFSHSAPKDVAYDYYMKFSNLLKELGVNKVVNGVFGAHMSIETTLKGPNNLIFDTSKQ